MIEFGQPLALWTGLAVALPILAHLAYRQIAEKLPFSSLRFIRSSPLPRSGRRSPSDLFLLLLRLVLFILITLLLADPHWRGKDLDSPDSEKVAEILFLLDTTPSMAGWAGWTEALTVIRTRLGEEASNRYGLLLIQNNKLTEWPIGTPIDQIIAGLDRIDLQNSPAGMQALIDRAPQLFSSGVQSKKIVLVSDFQKSSWQEVAGNLANEEIDLEFVPVGHGKTPWMQRSGNQAVVKTRVAPGGNEKVRVWTAVRNFDENRSDLNVSLLAGEQVLQTTQVTLSPQSTEQVQFTLPASKYAQAVIRIEKEDAYAMDNNQSIWILPPPARTFGFWKNTTPLEEDLLEEQFLRAAIESAGDGAWNRWRENDERAKELRLGIEGPSIDLLMVPGISGWFEDEGLDRPLFTHLENGGTVIFTPPSDSHVRMNQALKETGLLSFTFGGVNRTAPLMEPYRIEVIPEGNRLNAVFSGDSIRDLYLSQIRKFLKVKPSDELETPLYDRTGHPLVLIKSFPNGGRMVFFTFRMVPEWTDLPMRNSFLPLLIELGALSFKDEPDGGVLRLEAGDQRESSKVLINSQQIGLFQLGEKRIEVMHPLAESMPEVMSKNELVDSLAGGLAPSRKKDLKMDVRSNENAQSLWLWFAFCAAVLLVLEMILSLSPRSFSTNKEVVSG